MKTYKVTINESGLTLQKWLKKKEFPYILIQKFFRKKLVKINRIKANKDQVLNAGDEILLPEVEERETKTSFVYEISKQEVMKHFTSRILFEDENIIAIDKEQGIATQGGSKVKISIDGVLQQIALHSGKQYHLVHRLDKDTSGLLLIAKNRETASKLGDMFKNREIEKTYIAIAIGKIVPMEGSINLNIGKTGSLDQNEKMFIDAFDGKKAITDYKVLEYYGKTASLVEVYPQTGRKHQIRVHFAAIGHPILGDGKYGGSKAFVEGLGNKMHLHAFKLSCQDKILPKNLSAPLPDRFVIET